MLRSLQLLLPALVPSWNFFDIIAPAPFIEYAALQNKDDTPNWQAFRPRPQRLSTVPILRRLFWNPNWNESLFLVSCAERLLTEPTDHSRNEILARIKADITPSISYLQFRLVLRHRLQTEIAYLSQVYAV